MYFLLISSAQINETSSCKRAEKVGRLRVPFDMQCPQISRRSEMEEIVAVQIVAGDHSPNSAEHHRTGISVPAIRGYAEVRQWQILKRRYRRER